MEVVGALAVDQPWGKPPISGCSRAKPTVYTTEPASPPEYVLGDALLHIIPRLEGQTTGFDSGDAPADLCLPFHPS